MSNTEGYRLRNRWVGGQWYYPLPYLWAQLRVVSTDVDTSGAWWICTDVGTFEVTVQTWICCSPGSALVSPFED